MLCNSVQTFFVYQQNLSINVYFFPFKNENNLKGSLEIIVEINFLLYRIILTCFRVFFVEHSIKQMKIGRILQQLFHYIYMSSAFTENKTKKVSLMFDPFSKTTF